MGMKKERVGGDDVVVPCIQGNGVQKRATSQLVDQMTRTVLPFTIHSYSSHSGNYHPRAIGENRPTDQASRWSSGTHDQDQFVTLAFGAPVVAQRITFGKFHRAHVCNLKEFKVFGGPTPENMMELLHNGLKNDTEQESFELRTRASQMVFPIQFLKIVPLATFGANFNYSIWFVMVEGIKDRDTMANVVKQYHQYQEFQTTRLCLKHFRQRNMMHLFELLQQRTGVSLEHPLLTQLHRELVQHGDLNAVESILHQLHEEGIYQHYCAGAPYRATWRRLWATNQDGDTPSPRGGHQMCIDVAGRKIYLLGGWNGSDDLADFWVYDIDQEQWHLLATDTQSYGGPGARSCHKMIFDPKTRSIFVLGRYAECQAVQDQRHTADFYRYYTDHQQWIKISDNTSEEKGPGVIFDHQMSLDSATDTLYVFGGRKVSYDSTVHIYSGLYAYHIASNDWRLVAADSSSSPMPSDDDEVRTIKSRVGHSMLFHPGKRQLYIFAGQRVKDYLSDMITFGIDTNVVKDISPDFSREGGPDAGYTQRATIDPISNEIYVLSGYMKQQSADMVKNGLWVYSIDSDQWTKVYQNHALANLKHMEPCPRFAHQMVYDPITKSQFVFGGNPGDRECTNKRLDDFWQLSLYRPNPDDILRQSMYLVRMQHLKEMCIASSDDSLLEALDYLRSRLTPLVNHDNAQELYEFRQLCARLCLSSEPSEITSELDDIDSDLFAQRNRVFDRLLAFIPDDMKEPKEELLDAVRLT
ncbi:Muskelin N-terminus-domain-containing protein [Gongronella butleri]|nr:Muskelin N-terminus-domain-containing protein [Gongronella butleri]